MGERLLRDGHTSFCCSEMRGRDRTCGHEGVRASSRPPAHARDEFVVRVEGPLADILFGWVQSVCEEVGARRSANGCSLLDTNCSGPRTICVRGRGPVFVQRVGGNVR